MPKEISYHEQVARKHTLLLRDTLKDLPMVCSDFIRSIQQTTAPLTRLGYARDLRVFFRFLSTEIPEFGNLSLDGWNADDLKKITSRHIELYLEYLTYYTTEDDAEYANAELGKMRKLASLRSFYKYLFKNNIVQSNVSVLVDMPKRHTKPIIHLEVDEVARLLDMTESGEALTERQKKYHAITQKRDVAMLTLFLGTGIRVSECIGLDMDDIDFGINGFLVTRKGGNQVILYFPDEVADVMKDYIEWRKTIKALSGHEEALFLSIQNKRITVRAVENLVKKYARQFAPLKRSISPHKLRSTFGTNLYQETGDIYLVADVLGHVDINTTKRHYAAMSDSKRRQAAKSVVLRTPEDTNHPPT